MKKQEESVITKHQNDIVVALSGHYESFNFLLGELNAEELIPSLTQQSLEINCHDTPEHKRSKVRELIRLLQSIPDPGCFRKFCAALGSELVQMSALKNKLENAYRIAQGSSASSHVSTTALREQHHQASNNGGAKKPVMICPYQ